LPGLVETRDLYDNMLYLDRDYPLSGLFTTIIYKGQNNELLHKVRGTVCLQGEGVIIRACSGKEGLIIHDIEEELSKGASIFPPPPPPLSSTKKVMTLPPFGTLKNQWLPLPSKKWILLKRAETIHLIFNVIGHAFSKNF
jgi:hypothetical protein